MKNIQDFHEKKKNWKTWDDKEKDLAPYLGDITAKLECKETNLSVARQEADLLKTIRNELKAELAAVRDKWKDLKKPYFSLLEEIYKLPGCFDELMDLLESYPSLNAYERYMITQDLIEQYDHGWRVLKKNSSTPLTEKEIEQRDEFLKSKCVEIAEARAKLEQLGPQLSKVFDLFRVATHSMYFALDLLDNCQYRSSSSQKKSSSRRSVEGNDSSGEDNSSSSSRKKFSSGERNDSSGEDSSSSSSGEDSSSSSSRENKRARK